MDMDMDMVGSVTCLNQDIRWGDWSDFVAGYAVNEWLEQGRVYEAVCVRGLGRRWSG
jgi:hypothetical protein